MNRKIILTCEHAGNQVPEEYCYLFGGTDNVLATHRGYDIGALSLAEAINRVLDAEIFTYLVTRLLVDLNRSPGNPSVFSEFTKGLSKDEKRKIIREFYEHHRGKVEEQIQSLIQHGYQVLHLAVHTFTPQQDGIFRDADIGLLYDPQRPLEKTFCKILGKDLCRQLPHLRIRMNYPYRGTMDGFTTWLRKEYEARHYLGIEIEVNQKFAEAEDVEVWERIQKLIAVGLQSTLEVE